MSSNKLKNILIPVDFSFNTELAIKKGIELMDTSETTIHLLHVERPLKLRRNKAPVAIDNLPSHGRHFINFNSQQKLEQWKELIEDSRPGASVKACTIRGISVEDCISLKAAEINPDLIIIAKTSSFKWISFSKRLSPVDLARKTHNAVLITKPGSLYTKIKSIVVPVNASIPKRKLQYLSPLAWRENPTVYILSILNEQNGYEHAAASETFTETLKMMKEKVNCQIIHRMASPHNVGKSIFEFTKEVNADLLVVNPNEAKLFNFTAKDLSDMIRRDSKLQVLAIDPNIGN